ncbi:MAG: HAD-IA family hydrolase [Armatimonadia bacterium]|nr:HAD-IA family hydrolase [Armatimonadia bacterium]
MHTECQAVLMDLDGVLVDSSEAIRRQWERWAEPHGIDVDAIMRVCHGRRAREIISIVAPDLNAEVEAQNYNEAEAQDMEGVRLVSGAKELLVRMPSPHWAVVTSAVRPTAEARLQALGLPDPPVLITAEDTDRGKPDPQCFLQAAIKLESKPELCVVFEDAPAGIEAAKAASMQVVGVATYRPAEELEKAGVDVVTPDLRDVRVEAIRMGDNRFMVRVG